MKYSFEDRRVVCKGDYWIAPDAIVIGSVVLEPNASVWFGCIVRADNDVVTIGENSQLQDGCVLHVDPGFPVTIGRNVSVGHMAMLHGCTIGDGSLIGIKSVILNGAKIGLHGPEGGNDASGHAELVFGAGEGGGELLQLPAADIKAGLADGALREFEEGLAENALRAVTR